MFLVTEHKDEQRFYKLSSTCRVTLIESWSDRWSGDGKNIAAYLFFVYLFEAKWCVSKMFRFSPISASLFISLAVYKKKPPIILENIFATNKKYHGKWTAAENLTSLAVIFDRYCHSFIF